MSCRGRCASREITAAAGAARVDDRSINATSICTRARPVAKSAANTRGLSLELVELVQNRLPWLP